MALILPGCQKDEPGKTEEPPKEANLLTFGFAEADNEGVIIQDYAGTITGTNVTVAMPKDVEKTALKACFTVSPDATVTVDGTAQESGATVNDFSAPVDYIVSNGDVNNKYTVTVTKEADYVWTKLGTFTGVDAGTYRMKVNPVTGEPYVLIRAQITRSGATEAIATPVMIKYSEGQWSYVGSKEGISSGAIAAFLDFTFDSKGNPYIVYPNQNTAEVGVSGMATVHYFNGTEWSLVGQPGITSTQATHSGIALMDNGNPMILTYYNKASGPIARRELAVSTYSGTAWTTDQTIPGRVATKYGMFPTGKLVNGTTYWALFNQTGGTFSVYSYKGGAWTTIADDMIEDGGTSSDVRQFRMDVDSKENIYIGICDNANDDGVHKPRITKYNSATKSWSQVGVVDIDISKSRDFDIAVSPLYVPFVIYRDGVNYPTIINIDSDTKTWTTPQTFEQSSVSQVHVDFDPNTGVGYALYDLDSTDTDTFVLWKYDRPAAE